MVKLRNIGPQTVEALDVAYRFAHGEPELDLRGWLHSLPDAGARLHAIDLLLDDETLHATCSIAEQQQALRVAVEVIRTVMLLCRDRETSIEEMVEELMRGTPAIGAP